MRTSVELLAALEHFTREATKDGRAALALSGGIDSAILARFMPEGSRAYTFRCVVPGVKVIDESGRAAMIADICGLKHEVIDITWEDVEAVTDGLMRHKGSPMHSIEAQIYIGAMRAKAEGFTKFILGDASDAVYGGYNGLLAKDWLFGEFVDRYSYVMPYKVLREPVMNLQPFCEFERDGRIDAYGFIDKYFNIESLGSYYNACGAAGVEFVDPYSYTRLDAPLDYARIRSGDTKYLVREAFRKLYPSLDLPEKIPMPRPVNEWFKDWRGPSRPEFFPHCTDNFTGDQKWMVWCLERFLNL
ncbi:MAG: asparagine synthase [Synergistaceae bacterium]|nr:asparagine synthase [Synergistaceae bacterium]